MKYECENCGEILKFDDLVYVHRKSDLYFCSRECEKECLEKDYEPGEEYYLEYDDFLE